MHSNKKSKTLSITATQTVLCSGEMTTLTLVNPPTNVIYNWAVTSPYLQILSGQGTTSVVVQHIGPPNVQASSGVTCQFSNACYDYNAVKTIWLGRPEITGRYWFDGAERQLYTYLDGDDPQLNPICYLQNTTTNMTLYGGGTVTWTKEWANPNTYISWQQVGNNLSIYPNLLNQLMVFKVRAENGFGNTTYNCLFQCLSCSTGCKSYSIFPNPASDYVNITNNRPPPCKTASPSEKEYLRIIAEIKIYDINGILKKMQKENKTNLATISLVGLPRGMYFVEISDGVYKEFHHLLVQR